MKRLEQIRREAQAKLKVREGDQPIKVVVGMGTCGIAAGAREVMTTILDELGKREVDDVMVTQTGCIGLCQHEPLVEVVGPGGSKVTYKDVDAEKARKIVAQHVVNGQIVGDLVLNR